MRNFKSWYLKARIARYTYDMAGLLFNFPIGTLTGNMAGLDSRVGTPTDNMVTLASKIDKIDANQVPLETEIMEKIRALFDARPVNLDCFASIKDTLARIEADQESFRYIL